MRFKPAVALLLIVVVGTTTFPVTGQEEPLPVIQAKGSPALTPSVILPAEVAVPVPLPTLEEAARANDFLTFDALYRDAVRRGDSVAAFTPLHELWTYGITDPIGAFFAADIYERLNRAYPGFERYIAEYRIVDSNGNVFYPTSETRTFLLDRALEGRATNVQLVDNQRSTPRVELRDTIAGSVWDRTPVTSQRSTPRRTTAARSGTPASSPAGTAASRRRTSPKATRQAAAVPTKTEPKAAPKTEPRVEQKAEPKAAARNTSAPLSAGSAGPASGNAGAPVATTAAAKEPVAIDTAAPTTAPTTTTPAEPPVVVRAEPPATDTTVATDTTIPAPQPTASDNTFGGRGVLLLVIGLIGVGLLAMMLRTPREAPASIMEPPSTPPSDKPSGPTPVEPIRRPSAAPEPPPPGKNRAGGSHG